MVSVRRPGGVSANDPVLVDLGSSGSLGSENRVQVSHTAVQKQEFLAAALRLGSVAGAARELGINRRTGHRWVNEAGVRSKRQYTPADKERFYAAFDRTGSIVQAARDTGIKASTVRNWMNEGYRPVKKNGSSESKEIVVSTRHSGQVIEEFLTRLRQVGSVTQVAKELGLSRSTCSNWASEAGIVSSGQRIPSAKHIAYLDLRSQGISRKEAALQVGVSKPTSYEWDHKQSQHENGSVPPESAAVAYNQGMEPLGLRPATNLIHSYVPAVVKQVVSEPSTVALKALERVVSSRYLSLEEREEIAVLLAQGKTLSAIGQALERSTSSISREVQRHSHPTLGYRPYRAHRRAVAARSRAKGSKLKASGDLRNYVKMGLLKRWSPEQISMALIKDFPDDKHMRVSHETIYQALYVQARGGLKREVKEALRTGRTRRKSRKNPLERASRFRDPMVNISERPADIEDRTVPGHWEGDLIVGTRNQSAIATLVERTTRYVMLVHLPRDHSAESVRDGLIKTMSTLPAHLRGSLTWDQGAEMAKHKAFSLATDMDVYFCDPASPWQRGSNENTNGLLRQYFPKGTNLNVYGPEDLEHVAHELNARPRKTLNWDTPAEQLRDLLVPK